MAEKKKTNKHRRVNIVLALFSAFIAVFLWLFLSLTVFTDVNVSLYDVDIDFDLEGSYAKLAGLSVIDADIEKVNLSFTGKRDSFKDYSNEDVRIRLNLDNVKASGSYDIPLIVESKDGDRIQDVVMVPESVHIFFDKIDTKVLSTENGLLKADISNIYAESGYGIDLDGVRITPSSVTISGPKDYIEQVTSCVLSFNESRRLKSSANISADNVTLYNGNAVFDHPNVTLSADSFNIYVPVYITKELPLRVTISDFTNQVDLSTIKYTLSTDSILVRSENSRVENMDGLNLGYIDIRDIYPGYVKTFQIPTSSDYTNISGIDTVQVTFELEGYSVKSVTLPNTQIHAQNGSADFRVTVEQDLVRAEIVGPSEIIDSLDASNFIGQINLMDYALSVGPRMMTAYIIAPNYPQVWARGIIQVYVSLEPVVNPENLEGEENADGGAG